MQALTPQKYRWLMDQLSLMANEAIAKTVPKSALGKALRYLREQYAIWRTALRRSVHIAIFPVNTGQVSVPTLSLNG